jgi:hypothetical protein
MSDYRTVNRANWDDRAQAHAVSERLPHSCTLQAIRDAV